MLNSTEPISTEETSDSTALPRETDLRVVSEEDKAVSAETEEHPETLETPLLS